MKIAVIKMILFFLLFSSFSFGDDQRTLKKLPPGKRQKVSDDLAHFKARSMKREKQLRERRLRQDVIESYMLWSKSQSASESLRCDQALEQLIETEEISLNSQFTSAQIARLLGKPEKAIRIIESAIARNPEQISPVGGFPIKITGRLMMGALWRETGKVNRAFQVYQDLRKSLDINNERERVISIICSLYLAEIAEKELKNTTTCLRELKAIESTPKSTKEQNLLGLYNFYISYANFEWFRIREGNKKAMQKLEPWEGIDLAKWHATSHLCVTGLAPDPMLPTTVMDEIQKGLFLHTKRMSSGSIDTRFLCFYLGFDNERRKLDKKAIENYEELIEDEAFFSPLAGINVAELKLKQGEHSESQNIFDDLKIKYPGYGALIKKRNKQY